MDRIIIRGFENDGRTVDNFALSSVSNIDEALIDRLFDKRRRASAAATNPAMTVHVFRDLVDDFTGLRDVSAAAAQAAELSKQKDVKSALARERSEDDAEARQLEEVFTLEAGVRDESRHLESLGRLRDWLSRCARQAGAAADSPERRRARRVLRTITMGAAERVPDDEYLRLLRQYRQPTAARGAR